MNKIFTDGDRKIYITDDERLIPIIDELFSNRAVSSDNLSELEPMKRDESSKTVGNSTKFSKGEFKGKTPEEVIISEGVVGAIKMFKTINTFDGEMKTHITNVVKEAIKNDLNNRAISSSLDDLKQFINLYGCMLSKQIKTLLGSLSVNNIEEFYNGNFGEKVIFDFYEALHHNLKKRVET